MVPRAYGASKCAHVLLRGRSAQAWVLGPIRLHTQSLVERPSRTHGSFPLSLGLCAVRMPDVVDVLRGILVANSIILSEGPCGERTAGQAPPMVAPYTQGAVVLPFIILHHSASARQPTVGFGVESREARPVGVGGMQRGIGAHVSPVGIGPAAVIERKVAFVLLIGYRGGSSPGGASRTRMQPRLPVAIGAGFGCKPYRRLRRGARTQLHGSAHAVAAV